MTVRELIAQLEECDDDIKDYTVGITFVMQLNDGVRLSARATSVTIQDNVDVAAKILWLKTRRA